MKVPPTITVLSHRISVQEESAERLTDKLGETVLDAGLINIRASAPEDVKRDTMLHEVLHACIGVAGHSSFFGDKEEHMVALLTPVLLHTMRENPDLAAYLLEPDRKPARVPRHPRVSPVRHRHARSDDPAGLPGVSALQGDTPP